MIFWNNYSLSYFCENYLMESTTDSDVNNSCCALIKRFWMMQMHQHMRKYWIFLPLDLYTMLLKGWIIKHTPSIKNQSCSEKLGNLFIQIYSPFARFKVFNKTHYLRFQIWVHSPSFPNQNSNGSLHTNIYMNSITIFIFHHKMKLLHYSFALR